ncbi:probable RNA-binding protein ARP1 isoform X2 [Dioscorea cayenensis subsp. rotundata]|uniref:Probable RNA-binding protein ARP1 isoform X2 n=1 Tax=Dioscorea cayennensis subsp. rotundata TaxID=55577 RepID=A0AB40CD72_DIOCR|nr:probable RNA-binding protein ARP1 isoform X2 [Dioscorea cayenensis subsp. rotundata]
MNENKLRKVFVGGLGWETEKEALREHFSQFGDIVEAVIISDKCSGRSKGYGFITFTNSTSAIKACQNPTPFINGRRANCNLAFLRSRRLPSSSPPPPPPPPSPPLQGGGRKVVGRGTSWYCYAPGPYNHITAGGMTAFYVASAAAAAAPAYGYSPSCISNYGYNQYSCQGTVLAPNAILHMYPIYHFQHHQPQVVGIPAQFFSPAPHASALICGFTTTFPVIISDPLAVSPTNVEAVKGCS